MQSLAVKMICLVMVLWISMKVILPVNFFTAWGVRFLNGFFWYIVGYQFGVVGGLKCNKKSMVLVLGLFTFSIITAYANPGVSLWSNSYGKNFLIYIFGGVVESLWLGVLCKWFIPHNSFLELLGKNTITILAVHEPIKRVVLKIIETIARYFGIGITISEIPKNAMCALVIVAIVVACSVGVVTALRWIKSYMPLNVKNNWMGFIR